MCLCVSLLLYKMGMALPDTVVRMKATVATALCVCSSHNEEQRKWLSLTASQRKICGLLGFFIGLHIYLYFYLKDDGLIFYLGDDILHVRGVGRFDDTLDYEVFVSSAGEVLTRAGCVQQGLHQLSDC